MAPEQFEGRAVFASDLYSLGVTMYQMLTGELPYDTPAPADLDRLRRGELVRPPRSRNAQVPLAVSEIVMRALAASVTERYQRAEDLLHDILTVRKSLVKNVASGAASLAPSTVGAPAPVVNAPAPVVDAGVAAGSRLPGPSAVRTREVAASRFCWNCRKPLPARAGKCPFCGESQ